MKLEKGDALERENLRWIRENIPEYEDIWSIFIGHNGQGSPLPMFGLSAKQEKDREVFYQAHYTVLFDLLQLRDSISQIKANLGSCVPDPRAYMAIQKEITAFLSYVGQVRDQFRKIDGALHLGGDSWKAFQDLYQNRCSLLHGTIPAQRIDDGFLKIPKLAGIDKTDKQWHDGSLWSQSSNMDFEHVENRFEEIFREVLTLTRGRWSECLGQIKKMMAATRARLDERDSETNVISNLSGVRYFYSSTEIP